MVGRREWVCLISIADEEVRWVHPSMLGVVPDVSWEMVRIPVRSSLRMRLSSINFVSAKCQLLWQEHIYLGWAPPLAAARQ